MKCSIKKITIEKKKRESKKDLLFGQRLETVVANVEPHEEEAVTHPPRKTGQLVAVNGQQVSWSHNRN